ERVHSVEEALAPRVGRSHLDEALDVDRGDDAQAGSILLAVGGFHTYAAATFDDETGHQRLGDDRAPLVLDRSRQRPRQAPRPPDGDGPTPLLAPSDDRICEISGSWRVERLERLERHPGHEGLDVAALELLADDLPRRH